VDHLAVLEGEVAAMTAALAAADPATPVEACPGWTVRELGGHITGVHRWVLAALDGDGPPPYDETPQADPVAAYDAAAQSLVARLRELPTDHPCWTFDRSNPTASFWRRRQVHEVSVHLWDVAPYELTDAVAEDGIDEVLDFFLPRQVKAGRTTLPAGTLELRTPHRSWTVGEGPATVVEGSASELLLALWGRGRRLPDPWAGAGLTP
jgi:uncharacterized protein (TIGR03083 family)